MKPSFILLHAENLNANKDSVCNLILVPVIDGVRQEPKVFLVDPHSDYDMVMSGITKEQIEEAPDFETLWPEIRQLLEDAPFVVCSADGNSVTTLAGTVSRLGLTCPEIPYINAKAICRRTMDHFSYNLQILADHYFQKTISYLEPVDIAETWADLVIIGLESAKEDSFVAFAKSHRIQLGMFSSEEFHPCRSLKLYQWDKDNLFDPSSVAVDADPDHPFYGANIVFTGKLESMTRDQARSAVVAIGGNAPERLTMDTNILVVGNQDLRVVGEKGMSGKMKTAAKYKEKGCNIEVIDESDFVEQLGQKNHKK